MTNLEWINEQIEECKRIIESIKIRIIEDSKHSSLVKSHNERIEELKPILKHLEQIKAKLEAWEVVKKRRSYAYITYKNLFDLSVMMSIDDPDCEKLLKALEVENA